MRVLVVLALVLAAAPAAAQTPGDDLAIAADAIAQGDYAGAVTAARRVQVDSAATKADLAESHRLLGLAFYFQNDTATAETEFLAYLRIDLDGRLDPSQVPPEAIAFFEDVRARHAADLRKLRPRQRRYSLLNLVPPGGQIQNRDYTKAWVLGGFEVALAATHLGTFFALRSMCSINDLTCDDGGSDSSQTDTARRLQLANRIAGVALIAVYVYGVYDGYRGYKRIGRERQTMITAAPVEGGMVAGVSMSFW